jgi:hypothetical protein
MATNGLINDKPKHETTELVQCTNFLLKQIPDLTSKFSTTI